MDLESIPAIPHFIEEVPDFKGFITSLFLDSDDTLVWHTKPKQMKFYLDSSRCPVMKYKLVCIDIAWPGEEGKGIKLRKEDTKGQSLWPRRIPFPVPQKPMRGVDDILKGILNFIKY